MNENYSVFNDPETLKNYKLLGKGNNGSVYLMPDNKALKVFKRIDVCKKEYIILEKVSGNNYFPKVYEYGLNYIVRDCVDGISLTDYIKQNGLSRDLSIELISLLQEFKKLNFTKLDTRCKDIMVRDDGSLMTIDPKNYYRKTRNYPRHLCKGLRKLGVLDSFMNVLKSENPRLYKKWSKKIYNYLDNCPSKPHKSIKI